MSESEAHAGQIPVPEHVEQTQFPDGMRVLAVDDNMVCLKLVATLLQNCRYKVTMTTKGKEALEILRKNKDNFDIVITDVHMLDMDGFKLLEIIGLEMDIPVIMMSANDDQRTVMKGIEHGARDYLLKPVRMQEIKNIWQHVIRKTLSDPNKLSITKGVTDQNRMPLKRHRDKSKEKEDETNSQSDGDSSAQKKHRVTWSQALHLKFIKALQTLGGDNAVPKKILEIMDEPGLSRENVASHLQKYRKHLKKTSDRLSQHRDSEVDSKLVGRRLKNTIASGVHGCSNARMISFGHPFPKLETVGACLLNPEPLWLPPNQQDVLLQQYPQSSQMLGQMQQGMHIPGFGNVPSTPLGIGNHGLKFQNFKLHDDYMDIASHIPIYSSSCGPGPSSLPLVGCASNSYPAACFGLTGSPYQMVGDASIEKSAVSQHGAAVGPVYNSFPEKHEGRNLDTFNGNGDLDFRGQVIGCPSNMQGPVREELIGNGQKMVHHPIEYSELESSVHRNSCSSTDDDLTTMVKQFSNNAAPKL